MGHGRGKSTGGQAPPPVPIADYNVTGDPNPDCTCNYFETGSLHGKLYYRREDGGYFIWWSSDLSVWIISILLDVIGGAGIWQRIDPNIVGVYTPVGAFLGNPVVAAGPH